MVAISLYRGNLHRVPDVPRRWLMPTPKISLKDFKILLNRRSRALSRLNSSTTNTIATTSNPNLKQEEDNLETEPQLESSQQVVNHEKEAVKDDHGSKVDDLKTVDDLERLLNEEEVKVQQRSNGGDDCLVKLDDAKLVVPENASNPGLQQEEKKVSPVDPNSETHKDDALSDKEKRKKEVEEKLQILNARKHNLVQVLKQILNAEEELRRRSNMQEMTVRPSVSLQVDVTNECGSMSRHVTPQPGSEDHSNADMEVTDADDGSNQNIHSRNLPRMSSMSPSSDSPHRRPAFSAVPNPSRASLGVASSPSRFAPTGQQGNPINLPTVSVSGTNYIASSPSPAGSGGTSVFRDARLPSPWN